MQKKFARLERLEDKKSVHLIVDICCDILGAFVFAVGLQVFTVPNQIAPGGVSGLATLLNYLFHVPIGLASFCMNLPLLFAALYFLGQRFTLKTLKSVVIVSLMVDLVAVRIPIYQGDRLLGALFGGIMIGAGLAVIFLRGSTTGGGDIAGRLLQLRFPHMQTGAALLLIDIAVILLSIVVFGNIESGLYGLISVFVSAKVIDTILYGVDMGKMVFIVSKENRQIAQAVAEHLERGATFLKARGAYSESYDSVLLCAVRKNQFYKLKKLVYQIDVSAFLIVSNAGEILGEGFSPMQREEQHKKR